MSVEIQTPQMSVSDNSTVTPFRDTEDPLQMLDGCDADSGDLLMNSDGKSPYADTQMVSLDVGPDATRFEIHGSILCQSTELAMKVDPWGLKKQAVALPELDEAAAHTLVHYLYTGRYQTLSPVVAHDKGVSFGYRLGICVYCAAVCYKLPGLAELAKERITSSGEDVSISNVLTMARDHAFPRLPEEEAWYPAYLEGVIDSAMTEDPQSFQKPDFITQVAGNSRLLQVVWKTVTNNFARAASEKDVASKDNSMVKTSEPDVVAADPKPVEGQRLDTAIDELDWGHTAQRSGSVPEVVNFGDYQPISESQNAYIPEPETVQEPSTAPLPVDVENPLDEQNEAAANAFETEFEDSLGLDAIEPTVRSLSAPEQFTHEVRFESSKMDSQMEPNSSIETIPKEPTKPLSHSRTDSFMQIEEVVPCLEKEDEVAEVVETSSQTAAESNEGSSAPTGASSSTKTSKKNKKHKKKKSSIVFH